MEKAERQTVDLGGRGAAGAGGGAGGTGSTGARPAAAAGSRQQPAGARTSAQGAAEGASAGGASGGALGQVRDDEIEDALGPLGPASSQTSDASAPSAGTSLGTSSGTSSAPARSSGLTKRKQTYKRVAGNVDEETELTLKDYIAFVTEIEGRAPDMDEVMMNALEALFKRAKGFAGWRKNRLAAPVRENEAGGVPVTLVPAAAQTPGAPGGASAAV